MPKVSVIIPVHNASRYLGECLDSVRAQTLSDIEVLCVDDGSTDGSRSILDAHAEADERLSVLSTAQTGAGAARNVGIDHASGDYLSFLDADDLFEPRMLELAYSKCVADRADVCVFHGRLIDADTGRVSSADNLLRSDLLPSTIPFSRRDVPDRILNFTSPAPWNKLFRREFVAEQQLRFQDLSRANDLLFTKLAVVKADRITIVDESLVYYRVGSDSNLQSNNDKMPLTFHEAHVALKQALSEAGVFGEVERSFVNLVLSNSLYNLHSLRSPEAFDLLYAKLRDEYFSAMGVDGRDPAYFFVERQYAQYAKIKELTPEGYLLDELHSLRARTKMTQEKRATAERRLKRVKASASYRVARVLTYLPRKLRRASAPRREEL